MGWTDQRWEATVVVVATAAMLATACADAPTAPAAHDELQPNFDQGGGQDSTASTGAKKGIGAE